MTQKKKKRPADINALAASIMKDATEPKPPFEEPTKKPETEKNPAAVALGRLGGKKGGAARAKKLSPERRKEIAEKAAKTRWSNRSQKPSKD